VPHPHVSGTTAALRIAPSRASTPLPGSFSLREDASTQEFDGGTVLLGGSPLRLFRISERARQLVARWKAGAPVGPGRGAQLLARRLVSSGAFAARPGDGTLGPPDVTVVVPVRDRPAQLDRALGALRGMDCIVVDDASADAGATKEIAERHGARFVGLTVNVGPAGARNAGLAGVHSALVAFVDSDCVPRHGWLGPLLGHFDDPLVAAVAPRIVLAPGRGADGRPVPRSSLDRGARAGPVRPGSRIPFVPSAALLVRVDAVSASDLFDTTLRGGEDVDLVWRLGAAGWDVRYEPASTVAHDGPATLGSFLTRRAFYGTTAAPLARRHGEALAPVHVSGWSLAVWTLAWARRPLLAQAVLAASVAILARRLRGLVRDPVAVAAHIAGGGTTRAALPALGSLTRAWSPPLVLALAFRRTRRGAALALLLPALSDSAADRDGGADRVRAIALHVADDVAYGAGVWVGCARERTVVPLIPRISWRSRVWSSGTLRDQLRPAPVEKG
jgi:mycofactocin system glycosyltransferase